MKNSICYLFTTLLISIQINFSQAQTTYIIKIKSVNGEKVKGNLLFASGDSLGINSKSAGPQTIRLSAIKSIAIHKKGKMGSSILIGAGIGAIVGGFFGLAAYKECQPNTYCINLGRGSSAAAGAISGSLIGIVAGAIAGSHSTQIKINSDQEKFDYFKTEYFQKTSPPEVPKQ